MSSTDGVLAPERVAEEALRQANPGVEFDPVTILLIAQLIVTVIKTIYECQDKPSPAEIRTICRKPTGVQWVLVTGKVRHELGGRYRKLGGRRLVDAGFKSLLGCSDADLRFMLHL